MAFVFRATASPDKGLQVGPGQYLPQSDSANQSISFAPFNSSIVRQKTSLFHDDKSDLPGPGQYNSFYGMAQQRIIVATDNKLVKVKEIPKAQAVFRSGTKRVLFQNSLAMTASEEQSFDSNRQRKRVCPVPKKRNARSIKSFPTISKITQGFGYKQTQRGLVRNESPLQTFQGTKQDSVGVGYYNLEPQHSAPRGIDYQRDKEVRFKYKSYQGPGFYDLSTPLKAQKVGGPFTTCARESNDKSLKQQILILKYIRDKHNYLRLPIEDLREAELNVKREPVLSPGEYYDPERDSFFKPKKLKEARQNFSSMRPRFDYQRAKNNRARAAIEYTKCQRKPAQQAQPLIPNVPFMSGVKRFTTTTLQAEYVQDVSLMQPAEEKESPVRKAEERLRHQTAMLREKIRTDLGKQTAAAGGPGPGSYELSVSKHSQRYLSSVFNSKSKRRVFQLDQPNQAIYDLSRYNAFKGGFIETSEAKVPFHSTEERFKKVASPEEEWRPVGVGPAAWAEQSKAAGHSPKDKKFKHDYFLDTGKDMKPGPGAYQSSSSIRCQTFNCTFKGKKDM